MSEPVPYPLPDLPRAPDSDLARMARRVLEHRDYEALTRLPDLLRDTGRDDDARAVMRALVPWQPNGRPAWDGVRENLLGVLFWDLFDWAATLAVYGRPISGTHGTVTVGDKTARIANWRIHPLPPGVIAGVDPAAVGGEFAVSGTFVPADVGTAPLTAAGLHATENHPDYEYAIHDFGHDPGPDWEPNPHARPWVPDTRCWMRRRAASK